MTIHLMRLWDGDDVRTLCGVEHGQRLYDTSVDDEYETAAGRRIEAVTGIRKKADCKRCLRIQAGGGSNR